MHPYKLNLSFHSENQLSVDEAAGSATQAKKPRLICEKCGSTFSHRNGLSYHKNAAHGEERPNVGPKCGESFKIAEHLNSHLAQHEKLYPCDVCGKSFSDFDTLIRHKKWLHQAAHSHLCLQSGD